MWNILHSLICLFPLMEDGSGQCSEGVGLFELHLFDKDE